MSPDEEFQLTEYEKSKIKENEQKTLMQMHKNEMEMAIKQSMIFTNLTPPVPNVSLTTPAVDTSTLEDDPTPDVIINTREGSELEIMGISTHAGTPRDNELDQVVQGLTRPRDKRMENAVILLQKKEVDTPGRVTALTKMAKNRKGSK